MQKKQLINLSILFLTIIIYQRQNNAVPVNVYDEIRVEGYNSPLLVDDNRQIRLHGEGPGTEPIAVPEGFDTDIEKYVAWRGMEYPVLVHCIKTVKGDLSDSACGFGYAKVVDNNDIFSAGGRIRSYAEHKELLRNPRQIPSTSRHPYFKQSISDFSNYKDCFYACKRSYPTGYVETMQYPTGSQAACHEACKALLTPERGMYHPYIPNEPIQPRPYMPAYTTDNK